MRALLVCALVAVVGCSKGAETPVSLTCGPGTHDEAGACVLTLRCGPGTQQSGSDCVGDLDAGATCAPGTHLTADDTCQADVVCGAGTHPDAGSCVSNSICGPGTHANGSDCEPDVVCGAGTVP